MAVTAAQVKELRDKTGAPMMDCKKALSSPDVGGDFAKAMDWLRAKGIVRAFDILVCSFSPFDSSLLSSLSSFLSSQALRRPKATLTGSPQRAS